MENSTPLKVTGETRMNAVGDITTIYPAEFMPMLSKILSKSKPYKLKYWDDSDTWYIEYTEMNAVISLAKITHVEEAPNVYRIHTAHSVTILWKDVNVFHMTNL